MVGLVEVFERVNDYVTGLKVQRAAANMLKFSRHALCKDA